MAIVCVHAIHLINDAYTDASTNTAVEMLSETSGTAADQELRPRIDSLNTHNQPIHVARSSSFVNENHDTRSRTASVGTGAARRPSFINGQEQVRFYGLVAI